MNDYDFYLRHASVHDGEWVGFALAWKGLGGVAGLEVRPHLRWRPWIPAEVAKSLGPSGPVDGSWGEWQWSLNVVMLDAFVGLLDQPPADGRTASDMRTDLLLFVDLPLIQLQDVDGAIYTVTMIGYKEQLIEPYDASHPAGGWWAQIQLAVPSS